ncbi:GNAT family N-acetyltransferase [Azospirillum thermophilum]|uniref:N-acetyltransferase n=1 Tax=Azospirillum thermophilum TaxID=2202148 RepID=A0A2S2CL86_9PROT|nr:GNAT family N-acetyltransferase [Azospirillum thermophilum]AWK85263.1 N-acetyltransferase [Azospirillum thermophilum]
MADTVRDNPSQNRYELEVDGKIAFADYRRDAGVLYISHVEAPPSLRGTGAAGRLMEGIVQAARQDGVKIVPYCSYAAAWLRRHQEHQDLVA